jgi:hypothetical protein
LGTPAIDGSDQLGIFIFLLKNIEVFATTVSAIFSTDFKDVYFPPIGPALPDWASVIKLNLKSYCFF